MTEFGKSRAPEDFIRALEPRVVARATDVNVSKVYVAVGLGVAIVRRLAVDPARDTDLAIIDAGDVFPPL
ncbi:hypothetical protein [Cupriavidus pauculus]|uniref:hypothetical protein n=1 Tax=Cupriavidus pauculus TaxID=82633 RepID=UPI001EE2FA0D|nr:hypothetical protein [Cupriavidus pauculus]GJG96758.1 hypothetical protein CBA19C6_19735 [Cupriavidus pauculus]